MTITLRAGVLNSGIQQNGTEFLTVDTSNNATLSNNLTVNGNTILGDATTDTLNVGNGGLVKDASGNVGIGTASPSYILHAVKNDYVLGVETNAASGAVTLIGLVRSGARKWELNLDSGNGFGMWNMSTAAYATVVDSSSNFKFNSGYGSAATAYGCRAWVNFNGTGTVAIRASGNVSSITDNGTGDYTVNFTTVMPDANYSVSQSSLQNRIVGTPGTAPTTSAYRLTVQPPSGSLADEIYVYVAIFR